MRSSTLGALALVASACQSPAQSPAPLERPRPAGASLAAAAWPTSVEVAMIDTDEQPWNGFHLDTRAPRFRTEPPAIARELNARFARYAKTDPALQGYVGYYYARCAPAVVNRFAVIVECGEVQDASTPEDAERERGAPAGLEPRTLAVWLQPGLPAIQLAQLAPGIDAERVIERVIEEHEKAATLGCDPSLCKYSPSSFSIDEQGIVFAPTVPCTLACDAVPRIPLAALRPTHRWAVQLVDRIRARVAAGEDLVEGMAAR